MIYTYIKKSVPKHYVELSQKLSDAEFNNIGSSFDDYLNDKWVLLSKKQVEFHKENPSASVKEVFDMQIVRVEHERSLQDAKQEMITQIYRHDASDAVNSFSIAGIDAWFSVQERLNYKQSVEAAKLLGVDELNFFVGNQELSVSTAKAEQMLAALQLYADECFLVTKRHVLAVENLNSIEDVDGYDFTVGYPNKPVFTL